MMFTYMQPQNFLEIFLYNNISRKLNCSMPYVNMYFIGREYFIVFYIKKDIFHVLENVLEVNHIFND